MRLVKKVQINIIMCKDIVVNGNDIEDGRKTSSNQLMNICSKNKIQKTLCPHTAIRKVRL